MNDSDNSAVLDNKQRALADYLRRHLRDAQTFRLVSAYFSVFGFDALAAELTAEVSPRVRFLFGAPASAGEIATGEQWRQCFDLTETGIKPISDVLPQRQIAQRCKTWIEREDVQIRAMRHHFLHGKMYHMESAAASAATVGSSNFTRRGLGDSPNPNIEINLAINDAAARDELANWFDELWENNNEVRDAKADILAALERWHKEYAPQFIYYKTLFEIFKEDMKARADDDKQLDDSKLYDSQVWDKLYEFQKDGAKSVINRLRRHNGCILADSVGLGKTYTALAAIRFFELNNERVLVLCPKKLEDNWRIYQASANNKHNPFDGDRFDYTLLAHTDLTRESGMAGNMDLAKINWGNFNLVVIDESHNFRNDSKNRRDEHGNIIRRSRYDKLINDIIRGGKTKVLMLSATPVNTSLTDLQNQIYLITAKNDEFFAKSMGVGNIKTIIHAAQKKFKEWEETPGKKDKNDLLENLGGDFLHLLDGITISRSRRQIKQFYAAFIKDHGDFPKHEKPQNEYPHTDAKGELSYQKIYGDIERINFHIYCPSAYVQDESVRARLESEKKKYNFNQETREAFLVAMMRINFMKRLESSAHSCAQTLQRTLTKVQNQITAIDNYNKTKTDSIAAQISDDEHAEDDEFVINRKAANPYYLRQLNVDKWRQELQKDEKALNDAFTKVNKITAERDGKLLLLKEHIKNKAKQTNRKLLVFTAFKDTAVYLYENTKELAKELGINSETVAGGDKNFNDILDRFAPQARESNDKKPPIDLLIATDCISEGQNLQDCDTVLNYDIHWNPVRLIQRFGRIDRIGSKNKTVRMINYWPTKDMDFYLNLSVRVHARMALADATATGDDNILHEDKLSDLQQRAQMDLHFRDRQILQMRDGTLDLDELNDSVSISDLTLDYFLTQLLRYFEKNREELEQAPPGIYAVADVASAGLQKQTLTPGAIFLFRQHSTSTNTDKNPIHPFYLVHVDKNEIRHGYMKAAAVLRLFEALAADKTEALQHLCDAFTVEISTTAGKQFYDNLSRRAIQHIVAGFDKNSADGLRMGSGGNGKLSHTSEKPEPHNLQLITWLIIKARNKTTAKIPKTTAAPPHSQPPEKPPTIKLTPPREQSGPGGLMKEFDKNADSVQS